ncbi:TetR/AcrR family transcriptional regulator [Corynebacterium aurimucosum]|uniref:TetR/AcrR family transcriptional regulator n=1 Tax=Corynebacterium aurimucosum TaxID=169292 RepID=UPI003990A8D9
MNIIHFVSRITVQKERNVRQGFEAVNSHRPKGRPHKALVTREKIAQAALTIVGEEGYEKLTMARIARRLNVGTSALYNHLSGKDDLLALIEDAVMEQVECSSLYAALEATPALSPRDALKRWAMSYRDVCARHVPLVRIIALTPISGAPRTVEMYEVLARVLKLTGLPSSAIMPRIVALESFIYGSAYDVHAPEDIFDLPVDSEAHAPALADARGAFLPAVSIEDRAEKKNPYADEPFRLGLEALLSDLPDEKNS